MKNNMKIKHILNITYVFIGLVLTFLVFIHQSKSVFAITLTQLTNTYRFLNNNKLINPELVLGLIILGIPIFCFSYAVMRDREKAWGLTVITIFIIFIFQACH